ncbi:UbiA family prenyltransferase [Burkholderia sp. WSM2232]|uniref:UbiA family prenyltransferase n=1 Tax=Burkholderia sp. WSM2232 TaxID=944436 RepID=UPI0004887F1A|nr:UbiA family prenyltransferase [Burkholderia sp. WSM2232]
MAGATVPLCVDLDGTLTHSDILIESFLVLIKKNPLYVFLCVAWILRGKGYLKAQIAARVAIDVSLLPYNARLVDFLRHERSSGRDLYLCTAGDHRYADQVASHFGFFKGVMASDASHNLSGVHKAQALSSAFGIQGFDYCGNARADIPVWKLARQAIVVGSKSIEAAAKKENQTTVFFEESRPFLRLALREMRVYQWVKNLLIFVPLLASHRFTQVGTLIDEGIAFLSFCLCASSVYLLNDMLDLDADRRHSRKRARPFASGELPLLAGIILMLVLLSVSASLAVMLTPAFQLVLTGYVAMTMAYSFRLKRMTLIDAFVLAALYTARIVAGGAAGDIVLSDWLIMFSVMIFLSLAMVKRYTELDKVRREGKTAAAGRGYLADDMSIVRSFGTAAGYVAVLVLALYMNSDGVTVLYRHPHWLWVLFALLLYWISRVWMIAFRGQMNDDPIVFAIKNRGSLFIIMLCVLTVVVAT